VINSYDPTALKDIEKAILAANVGVTPVSDGKLIRIPIPELSQERRAEITKVAKRMAEETRVAVRNVRRDMNEATKALEKEGKITEDARDLGLKEIQKSTDEYIKKIDDALAAKEKEVMVV
jgi:ribosome recycling factor